MTDFVKLFRFMGNLVEGDGTAALEELREDAPTQPAPPTGYDPEHPEKPCTARDDGCHCSGHTGDGTCIMVQDK